MSLYEANPSGMLSSTIIMTPDRAKSILTKNVSNRKLRKYWVDELASAIRSGEWKLTHQGVAISKTGRLLDGQHRLEAIASAGVAVPIIVTENCDDEMFAFIDKGIKRNIADSLGISKKVAETIKFMMSIAGRRGERPAQAIIYNESELGDAAQRVYHSCKQSRRIASSAACKAAAALVMVETGKYREISENYKNFVVVNYEQMTPSLLAFERQISTSSVSTNNNWDVFCRSYKCFSMFDNRISTVRIGPAESEEILRHARKLILDVVGSVLQNHS